MQRWIAGLALSLGVAAAAIAQQNDVQRVQVAPVQVQVAPAQVQIAPVQQIQIAPNADVAPGIALMPAMMPGNRLAPVDVVVVGRVVAFEPMDVEATPAPNQGKVNYRIAVVQVTEAIQGVKKDVQTIRVGFVAQGNVAPGGINGGAGGVQILPAVQPAIQPVPPGGFGRRPYYGPMQLQMGQDGIFMLSKHHKENFYLAPNFTSFINRQNNPNFDNEVKTTKQITKVMENPMAALKGEDAQERTMAAAYLITKYRTNTTGQPTKQEPISVEESKLILNALAKGDWTVGRFNQAIPSSFELFNQLGLTAKDGYNPQNIRNQQDIVQAMQKWLTDNSDKYVIQKLVADPNAKVQPGNPTDVVPLPVDPGVVRPIRPLPPVKIQPIKKIQIQPLPAPAPQPVPAPQVDPAPRNAVPQVEPAAPARRD
jgi:hypothetical protein